MVKEKSHRYLTECEKIDNIDEEYHQKKTAFAVGLRKAINEYNRVSMY